MDATQFREVVELHQRMVFSIALRVAGEYQTAEEIAQDVFLELFRGNAQLDSADHMRFWLRRVTVHRATDALRKQSRRAEATAEEWDEDLHASSGADDARPMSFGIAARLEELLQGLPEAMRVPVVLRYQEDMQPEEIAQMLAQPVATVKSNLQRGLKLMRRKAEVTMKEYARDGH